MTSTAEIGSTISHPGSVKINVEGAFIVESPESGTPAGSSNGNGGSNNVGGYYETKDIRLPNHTAVVSHIAVDVSPSSLLRISMFPAQSCLPPLSNT